MPKAMLVVLTNPASPDAEDEYNDWYDNTHLHDVVDVEGFVSAQRFRFVDIESIADRGAPSHRYLALYQVEGDDIGAVADAMLSRAGTDAMVISPALDVEGANAYFVEPIGEPVESPRRQPRGAR
jgi:hypothetical protein